ncbi:MAG: FixH family protein [Anaerolineae bacterium]|nr:FixH family protein [Anaerolineae bacterium]
MSKMKLAGSFGLILLILGIPTTLGILLLHESALIPSSEIPEVITAHGSADKTDAPESAIREEVLQSVLIQPTAGAEATEANSRIHIMRNGVPVPIRNGEAVAINDSYQVEVFFAPYPPTGSTVNLDLYLTRVDGEAVTDADVSLDYDMLYMFHGPFKSRVDNLGGGHYLSTLEVTMYGDWGVETGIQIPGERRSLPLLVTIYVWPA